MHSENAGGGEARSVAVDGGGRRVHGGEPHVRGGLLRERADFRGGGGGGGGGRWVFGDVCE